jgi:hypothetical protein
MNNEPFELKKTLEGARFIYDQSTNDWTVDPTDVIYTGSNWEKLAAGTFLSRETLDISGLSMQELTLFFASQGLQRSFCYVTTVTASPAGGAGCADVFIVSDVPLGDATTATPFSEFAGFSKSPDDYINTKFAQGRIMTQSTSTPLTMIESDQWNFGSGEPTASGDLYLYRWVTITSNAGIALNNNVITVPDMRYVATGIAAKEPDLVHINRLRLAYEAQQ